MASSDSQVYTDPRVPGAPGEGDVVVVVAELHPDDREKWDTTPMPLDGRATTIWKVRRPGNYPWDVDDPDHPGHTEYAHAVRRPTPEELAAYMLGRTGRRLP